MANISQVLKDGGNALLVVSAADLREFGLALIEEAKATSSSKEVEEYLTPKEAAKTLGKSIGTLWRWDKENYLSPIRVGRSPKYRKSDILKIMEGK